MARTADITRKTNETHVALRLDLDGAGLCEISTGVGFFDHMLEQIARHGFIGLALTAKGDLHVDAHHTVEDCGIALGQALAQALGGKAGIRRYGSATLPMDEALALCALDFSGRPCLCFEAAFTCERIGGLDTELIEEFFRALCANAGLNMHLKLLAGKNNHHMAEALFKAFAKALDQAVRLDPRVDGVLSTKGIL